MKRRDALALLCTGIATLAGCTGRPADDRVSNSPSNSPTGSSTDTRSPTPTPPETRRVSVGETVAVGDANVTVANPRVRTTVVQDNGIWQTLMGHTGQFVVVDVTADGAVPERFLDVDLRATVGGDPLPDGEAILVVEGDPGDAPRSPREWNERRVAFPYPAERPDTAAVRWETSGSEVFWKLPSSIRETLPVEPEFRVENLDASPRDGRVVLDIAVGNEGDRAGRFQAWVSHAAVEDASSIVQFDVPVGQTRRYIDTPSILEHFRSGTVTVIAPNDGELTRVELDVPEPRATESGSSG